MSEGNLIYVPPHDTGQADRTYSPDMSIDSSGNIYFTENGRHWLRKLTRGGIFSTVAGSPSQVTGKTDFVSGLSAQIYYPEALALMPDDSVPILDSSNRSLRR